MFFEGVDGSYGNDDCCCEFELKMLVVIVVIIFSNRSSVVVEDLIFSVRDLVVIVCDPFCVDCD